MDDRNYIGDMSEKRSKEDAFIIQVDYISGAL